MAASTRRARARPRSGSDAAAGGARRHPDHPPPPLPGGRPLSAGSNAPGGLPARGVRLVPFDGVTAPGLRRAGGRGQGGREASSRARPRRERGGRIARDLTRREVGSRGATRTRERDDPGFREPVAGLDSAPVRRRGPAGQVRPVRPRPVRRKTSARRFSSTRRACSDRSLVFVTRMLADHPGRGRASRRPGADGKRGDSRRSAAPSHRPEPRRTAVVPGGDRASFSADGPASGGARHDPLASHLPDHRHPLGHLPGRGPRRPPRRPAPVRGRPPTPRRSPATSRPASTTPPASAARPCAAPSSSGATPRAATAGGRAVRGGRLGRGPRPGRGRGAIGSARARQRGDLRRLLRLGHRRPLPPAQSQLHRFLDLLGGYTCCNNAYSYAAAEVIVPRVLGDSRGLLHGHTSWSSVAGHAISC